MTSDIRSMHRPSDVIRPKTKIGVQLLRHDGTVLEGYIYVGGQERVLDLLNNSGRFLPFETADGKFLAINKDTVALVEPSDSDRMEGQYDTAPSEPPIFR